MQCCTFLDLRCKFELQLSQSLRHQSQAASHSSHFCTLCIIFPIIFFIIFFIIIFQIFLFSPCFSLRSLVYYSYVVFVSIVYNAVYEHTNEQWIVDSPSHSVCVSFIEDFLFSLG